MERDDSESLNADNVLIKWYYEYRELESLEACFISVTAFHMPYIFFWMIKILKMYSSEGECIFLKQSKFREDEQSGNIKWM